ncbi:cytochrome c1 [Burkholderiaceae bacterium DAT-1]|nr:cytochrome c1 [Burkholderiaceae bacterium DAT-1]
MKTILVKLLATAALLMPVAATANTDVALDKAPIDRRDAESLQRGAQTFVNYCLSCHGANAMRFNRLTDLGLSEQQIKDNLMFTTDKVGSTMKVAMQAKDGKAWFGATPPDLSLIARSRGADWLYSYLRSFYRDESRPTGWNNGVFDKVGMPHVLWQMQGDTVLETVEGEHHEAAGNVVRSWSASEAGADGKVQHVTKQIVLEKAGTHTRLVDGKADLSDYNRKVTDLVNYLVWMGEPAQVQRELIGTGVVLFLLFLLFPFVYFLKREYWKDIH